ncbi:MAG: hypothetical protein J6U53_01480 [Tidjanibacter sp.]|nr:hypothetical protein [Tidjanibacter sp.]
MKRLVLISLALLVSMTLMAQSDAYKAFGKKYDKSGYEVSSVGRTAIRVAALAGDEESREMMRKFDLLVSVKRVGGIDDVLFGDFCSLVDGYNCVGDYSREESRVWIYMNCENTGFAMYVTTPEEQFVILIAGKDLRLDDLLPPELAMVN